MDTHTLSIVDSTLREGEQFAPATFRGEDRLRIAQALDRFGVETIETLSPLVSPRARRDLEALVALNLDARIAVHCRCLEEEIRTAADLGAQAIHVFLGTSQELRRSGPRHAPVELVKRLGNLVRDLHERDIETRFSCEDAFRTEREDLLSLMNTVQQLGFDRVGIADTVGVATPSEITDLVGLLRREFDLDIEFHGHNDSGCAIANAHAAFRAGATHIDTTILGIGERNGITSLSGLIARLYRNDREQLSRYRLDVLQELDELVAHLLGIDIPFNACITSPTAFTHKAGVHTHAVLRDPGSYESLDPRAFGRQREILIAHRLTGHHAIMQRARHLGLDLQGPALRQATHQIKALADQGPLSSGQVDALLMLHRPSNVREELA